MDDAGAMRLVEGGGDLDRDLQRLIEGSAPFVSRSASVSPSRYSMTRIRGAVLVADVVQRADVRMIELRDRARFAVEALAELRIGGETSGRTLMATVRSRRVSRAL